MDSLLNGSDMIGQVAVLICHISVWGVLWSIVGHCYREGGFVDLLTFLNWTQWRA